MLSNATKTGLNQETCFNKRCLLNVLKHCFTKHISRTQGIHFWGDNRVKSTFKPTEQVSLGLMVVFSTMVQKKRRKEKEK